jgi:hypothetical protein
LYFPIYRPLRLTDCSRQEKNWTKLNTVFTNWNKLFSSKRQKVFLFKFYKHYSRT